VEGATLILGDIRILVVVRAAPWPGGASRVLEVRRTAFLSLGCVRGYHRHPGPGCQGGTLARPTAARETPSSAVLQAQLNFSTSQKNHGQKPRQLWRSQSLMPITQLPTSNLNFAPSPSCLSLYNTTTYPTTPQRNRGDSPQRNDTFKL
jgi:hypothetical protein